VSGGSNAVAAAAGGAGAGIFVVLLAAVVFVVAMRRRRLRQRLTVDMELRSLLREQASRAFASEFSQAVPDCKALEQGLEKLMLPRSELAFMREMFDGHYGPVIYGQISRLTTVLCVSSYSSSADANIRFLVEARLLASLRHESIVSLVGLVADSPAAMAFEYLENGDLRSYLRACRPASARPKAQLLLPDLLTAIRRLANATAFLEQRRVLHGELCCKNVYIGSTVQQVKLSAFHCARFVETPDTEVACEHTDKSFFRWMAPETLASGRVTLRSEVWSFGVLMWYVDSSFQPEKKQPQNLK
jgi:serine/threonine protein kinase